jgi:hypothetical protein
MTFCVESSLLPLLYMKIISHWKGKPFFFGLTLPCFGLGGHCIPCHNWWHTILHMPGLHENVISSIGKKREMSVLRTSLSCVQICVQDLGIMRMTTSFTLQPTPATSSYGYYHYILWFGTFSTFWDSYKYKNMDKITKILENVVRCKILWSGCSYQEPN